MKLYAPIYKLKRQAKLHARKTGMAFNKALDHVAATNGFRRWNQLVAAQGVTPAKKVFDLLHPGDLLLLGARPGHGKTLFGLELAGIAAQYGLKPWVFSLEETSQCVNRRLQDLGFAVATDTSAIEIDTSNEIASQYIIEKVQPVAAKSFVVIDYLQALDHQRARPALQDQVSALRTFAKNTGAIVVTISQIDRQFELAGALLPCLADIRLPNPLDTMAFDKACFLHEGKMSVQHVS